MEMLDQISELQSNNGIAPIKSEFVINLSKPSDSVSENENDKKRCDLNDANEKSQPKKKRHRGQNKNRWKEMHRDKSRCSLAICNKLACDGVCPHSDSCIFSHDLNLYAQKRPADISDDCYLFKTFGKCQYGISCRFGSCHLNGITNIVDEEKFKENADATSENHLSKELQIKLRKRFYDFSPSIEAVENLKTSFDELKLKPIEREKKKIDFRGKLYLAPLTTVGNLPFRRVCKEFGADVTCGEMAVSTNLLEGQQSEWALLRRHVSEDIFGVQICGSHPDTMSKCAQLINETCHVDFIDINMGCPIDFIYQKGAGSGLMDKRRRLQEIIYGISSVSNVPLTLKMRTGVYEGKNIAHKMVEVVKTWPGRIDLVTIHGRSREQRYTKQADWKYINECAKEADPIPVFGSGDVLSFDEYYQHLNELDISGVMIGRGALIKPWIFTEIKEKRHWDISSGERFDILKRYVNYGLEHWGSDSRGVENTRRFLLEWLSFLYRYIPVGLLERLPQRINERPPTYIGRDELETLMASASCNNWIKISEMLLGPVPDDFVFIPKHKANSYQ